MLRVDKRCYATRLLCLCDGVDGQCCLTGTFRSVDLYDTSFRETAHAERRVKANTARGNDLHILYILIAHAHDRPFSEVFLYLRHCHLQCFELFALRVCFFFCHILCSNCRDYNSKSPSNTSFQGSPCLFSCSMNGSGSNSSTFQTPGLRHKPLQNIIRSEEHTSELQS